MKTIQKILATSLLAVGTSHAATLAYSQPFNNTTRATNGPNGFTQNISLVSWQAAFGDSANSNNATAFSSSSDSTVSPVNFPFTSGGGDNSATGTADGYLYTSTTVKPNQPHFYYVDSLGLGAIASFEAIEFDLRNTNVAESIQAAIKVDGNWFVSTTTYNNTTTNVWTNNISTTGTTWAPLTFTIAQPFAIGAAGALPTTGSITGVGLYNSSFSGSLGRIDNVEVFVVPEPSTSVLTATAVLLIALRRKR